MSSASDIFIFFCDIGHMKRLIKFILIQPPSKFLCILQRLPLPLRLMPLYLLHLIDLMRNLVLGMLSNPLNVLLPDCYLWVAD